MRDPAPSEISTARSARAVMLALGTFLLLFSLTLLAARPNSLDYFAPENLPFLKLLDRLPVEDILPLKMGHAEAVPAYDVTAFGNSRTYPVSKDEFTSYGRFFNFSIGSQSFRNSVRMLEALGSRGKAPKYAIIQFNHAELSLDNHAPLYPRRLFQFTAERLRDAKWLLDNGHSVKSALVFLWNTFYHEMYRERTILNAQYVFERLKFHLVPALYRLGAVKLADRIVGEDASRYSLDGSRAPRLRFDITKPTAYPFSKPRRHTDYPLLEADFAELVRISRAYNIKVLIYETPIMAHVRELVESNLSVKARSVRSRLKALCGETSFLCTDPPDIPHTLEDPWSDAHHPPARRLAKFLKENLDVLKSR